jgi:glucose-6-phosphate isomerase
MDERASAAAAWAEVERQARRLAEVPVRTLFAADPGRYGHLSRETLGLLVDFSRQRLDAVAFDSLLALARAMDLQRRVAGLFAGEIVNATEGRPALHMLLRAPQGSPVPVQGRDARELVRHERARLARYVGDIGAARVCGATGAAFTDVVNIGIGGSDLGPAMAVEALRRYHGTGLRCHFVSNVDGVQLSDLTDTLDPARTLVIVCSKTFATLETLANARLARAWIVERLGEAAVPRHFAAVSTNERAMNEFGIGIDARFAMWDWVGGRYSMWSAIGLVLELAIGTAHFEALLGGARAIDEHFRDTPPESNLPVILGLLAAWNRNGHGAESHAVLPYDQRLARFPAYLQQLEMESLGKRVQRDGRPVTRGTGPVIWGEPGSNAQHSFFQLLHQGTVNVSLDFLLPVAGSGSFPQQQDLAIANCLAQAHAFMAGYDAAEVEAELRGKDLAQERIDTLAPHKIHPGSRASTVIAFERLDPATLGKLIALYEHRVFVQSVLWDINPFDQWGVEFGKRVCDGLLPAVRDPSRVAEAPPELRGLLARLQRWRAG